jgi:hypothetical protein
MHKLPSAQEVFDIVVNHLFTQGRPAYDGDQGCMYRAPDGLRCAVGVLIPDDLYVPEFETNSSDKVIHDLFKSGLADWREHEKLLFALQDAHDNSGRTIDSVYEYDFNTTALRTQLLKIAAEFSLEYRRQPLAD